MIDPWSCAKIDLRCLGDRPKVQAVTEGVLKSEQHTVGMPVGRRGAFDCCVDLPVDEGDNVPGSESSLADLRSCSMHARCQLADEIVRVSCGPRIRRRIGARATIRWTRTRATVRTPTREPVRACLTCRHATIDAMLDVVHGNSVAAPRS